MRTQTLMVADKLYEVIREAVHAEKMVLIYIPWPFFRGWANINPKEVMTLLRGRSEEMVVDIDEGPGSLYLHLGDGEPIWQATGA